MLDDFEKQFLDKEFQFSIDIEFNTKTEITPRILKVSNAFGLGINETQNFKIYKDFKIGFNSGDIVFITGDSGGGKSLLLNKLRDGIDTNSADKLKLDYINPKPDDILIESLGETLEEAIYYLSIMGLNDAFIFLRKYKQLSDGQKYRYRLAKLLSQKSNFVFIDEFCANLDRTTAKVIAYNLQKICRRTGVTLIVATTHTDIIYDLNSDVLVTKKFMDDVKIDYNKYEKRKISFYDEVILEEGNINDYKKLAKYHYKNTGSNFPFMKIYKLTYKKELVGVAVYSPPFLQTKGRSIKFDGKYSKMTKEVVSELNKLFIRRSRNIISPKFRACGLGKKIAYESMVSIKDKKYIEAINIMGKYIPVNKQIGMEEIEITEETDAPTIRLFKWLKEQGLKEDEIHNPTYWRRFVETLTSAKQTTLTRMTGKVLHHPKIGLSGPHGKRFAVVTSEDIYKVVEFEKVKEQILTHIPKLYTGNTLYYIWENPNYKEKQTKKLGDFI